MFAVIPIEVAISGEIKLGSAHGDLGVDLGIGLLVAGFLGFGPMRLIAMFFAQSRKRTL